MDFLLRNIEHLGFEPRRLDFCRSRARNFTTMPLAIAHWGNGVRQCGGGGGGEEEACNFVINKCLAQSISTPMIKIDLNFESTLRQQLLQRVRASSHIHVLDLVRYFVMDCRVD